MAREILFKAKRIDNGEWVEGLLTIMWGQYHIINPNDENTAYPIDSDTICQYTGLTDKNGNKIWENDIVYARCNGLSGKGAVKYEKGCFVLKDSKRNRTYSLFGEWKFRVDGNIFDNPEQFTE